MSNFPSLGVNQIGSTNFSRVLAYCVLRTVTFTQTPVQVRRKITFAAPAQNSSVGCAVFFRVTRSVLISDRCAISRRIVCAVFAHWGQTWPRGARARARGWGGHVLRYGWWKYGCQTLLISPMIFFFLLFCSDSLTLVSVFSLFTHCNKYRIYFSIIEGGPGGASPRHHLLQICNTHLLWWITLLLASVFSLFIHCHKYRLTDTSQCIHSLHTLPQVPNLLLRWGSHYKISRLGPHKAHYSKSRQLSM